MQQLSSFYFILLISKLEIITNGELIELIQANTLPPTFSEALGPKCYRERNKTQREAEQQLLMKLNDLVDASERCRGKDTFPSIICFLFII